MLAARTDAKLRVIATLHPSSALDAPTTDSTPPPRGSALEGRHRASVEATLRAALNALPDGVDVEPEIHVDDPADVLLRVSAHVGLIVCGSRGYGPLRSVLLGGVSRRLVDAAQCPVLVLPREAGRPLQDLFSELRAPRTSPSNPQSASPIAAIAASTSISPRASASRVSRRRRSWERSPSRSIIASTRARAVG